MESSQFKQILLTLSNKMYRVAFSIVNDSDIAKDIVQDVCISLWNMRDKLSQIQNIDTFVMKIVKNKCIDTLRTNHICRFNEINTITNEYSTSADGRLNDNERLNAVMNKINLLPTQQKQILLMRSIQDLSLEEIEQATGLSNVNVRTLLSRARKKLRELCKNELLND